MAVAERVYELTAGYPRAELYGLTSQMRRAAVSIAANIAEGYGRNSKGAYVQSLRVSQGSLKELETLLILSERVGVAKNEHTQPLLEDCDSIGRMLLSLIRSLNDQGTT